MESLMKWQAVASVASALLLLVVVLARFPADRRNALAAEDAERPT
jgi:hypothetical protein